MPTRSRRERLGSIPAATAGERCIWLHCASVGEVLAARPLIVALHGRYPQHRLVITTMTATGAERVAAIAQELAAASESDGKVSHHFVPLDFPGAPRRFIARLRPELALLFETELWPNLIAACDRAGIPVAVVNGRLSPRAFRRYWRIRPLLADALARVDWLAAKSRTDAGRFRRLGMPAARTTVVGSLKFDLEVSATVLAASQRLCQALGPRPVWVAGSTHPGEEAILLEAHARLRQHYPSALLILVPRHPQRFDEVARLCREHGLPLARRSRDEWPEARTAVYLGDTMGELLILYGAADLAFVGGSLVSVGGHNLLEPAAMGVPVLSGPALANFSDIADELRRARALVEVANGEALSATLLRLFDDEPERHRLAEAGQTVVAANRGALTRTLEGLETMLPE